MPREDNKKLKYNHGEKSMRGPFVIYADLECLLEKMSTCHNNPEQSSTTKMNKHTPSVYSLFTHCSFDTTKNKLDYYRSKNCMKNFCLDLKEHATKIINYEKKEMISLTKEEKKIHREQIDFYTCKKGFNDKKYHKVRNHCHYTGKYRGAAYNICNLRYKTLKEIPVVFHNGFTYDYHFRIKELAEEFEEQFEYFRENTEKYIAFSVPIKKELDSDKSITYKIKFIDSFRFMSTSLSNLVDNLSDFIMISAQIVKLVSTICQSKITKLFFRCFECKKNYNKGFNDELIKRFANIYEFCNEDIKP